MDSWANRTPAGAEAIQPQLAMEGDNAVAGVGSSSESAETSEIQKQNGDIEKQQVSPDGDKIGGKSSSSAPNKDTPITYLYLTFETLLPAPNGIEPDTNSEKNPEAEATDPTSLPPCPDFSAYSDPFLWSPARKGIMVLLSCIATALTAYAAGSYAQASDPISAQFGVSHVVTQTGITTFCMGFALAPMVLAPFSEVYGRYPIFAVSGVIFTLFQAICGVVPGLGGMLVARFLTGIGGSVFSTMVGGVIADMFPKESRNTPMSLFSGSVLFGTGIGPLVSAVMVDRWEYDGEKWKWVFWHQVIMDAVLTIAVIIWFSESRGPVLLSRKARKLNEWYEQLEEQGVFGVWIADDDGVTGSDNELTADGTLSDEEKGTESYRKGPAAGAKLQRIRWLVKEDEQRASIPIMIRTALSRPILFFFTEPIVFFFSLWVSFAWAVLYLMFGSIPLVFESQYGFDKAQSGYIFGAMMIGAIFGIAIGIQQENVLKNPSWQRKTTEDSSTAAVSSDNKIWSFLRRKFPAESPESRLYFTCLTSVLLPLGLFLFGFSAQPSIHWIVPAIAVCFSTMGILFIYLSTFNYLADTYQTYASSALAAQSALRNILGGVFPLVTTALFTNLGVDAAGGLLGGIATVLTLVPWVLVMYGDSIRGRSKFAVALGRD